MGKGISLLLGLLAISANVLASGHLHISDAYARATPPNAPTSAVFFSAHNHSDSPISIVSASTKAANKVELHTVIMDGDVMQMRQVASLDIEPNSHIELKPGGLHVMLFELTKEFKQGDDIELTLNLSNGTSQTITAPIKKVMSGMKHHHH